MASQVDYDQLKWQVKVIGCYFLIVELDGNGNIMVSKALIFSWSKKFLDFFHVIEDFAMFKKFKIETNQ